MNECSFRKLIFEFWIFRTDIKTKVHLYWYVCNEIGRELSL